ncbi:substrate-binding domain-containing protein [Aquimarina sp. 2201CG14-23]|uniref:substrate-binding domain-containing protein n=1 Tax=Aquimarina mycalae TaxID=3040073 RepID=UPI002477E1B4|nr:substrate-binding domain-containing protein [Aquimarina sp. 2201CG14-23]MDH7446593.1 substrate-binding domain-containing protein [Aquimarina sp. 2201CG14-23]
MHTIKIGGVPEHFNLPWHLTIEEEAYLTNDIQLEWTDFPGGTGAMCEALRNKDIDIAIILTEGIVKDIIAGNPSKIVQTYIQSPLIWGIHVGYDSTYTAIDDLKNTAAAISRYGSGSHLMAYVHAQNNGWDTSSLQFEVIKNLDGAVKALTDGSADYFMWEHYTTKPLVDNKTFRRIADCPTPWPCFVIAVREEILNTKKDQVKTILEIINNTTPDFKQISSIDKTLAHRYDQQIEDIRSWLKLTEWSQSLITKEKLQEIQDQLFKLNIIDKTVDSEKLIHKM